MSVSLNSHFAIYEDTVLKRTTVHDAISQQKTPNIATAITFGSFHYIKTRFQD